MRLPRLPQFSLATLLTVMLLTSILVAGLGGLLRGFLEADPATVLVFLAIVTAGPLALTILISLARPTARELARWWRGRH